MTGFGQGFHNAVADEDTHSLSANGGKKNYNYDREAVFIGPINLKNCFSIIKTSVTLLKLGGVSGPVKINILVPFQNLSVDNS